MIKNNEPHEKVMPHKGLTLKRINELQNKKNKITLHLYHLAQKYMKLISRLLIALSIALLFLLTTSAYCQPSRFSLPKRSTPPSNPYTPYVSSPVLEDMLDYAAPKEYEIGGIQVTGVRFLDANALISLSGLKVGDKIKIPGEQVPNAIRKLHKQGILGDIQIYADRFEGQKVFLTLHLKERPRLSRFAFKGIRKGEQNTLTEKIALIKGKTVTDVMLKNTEMSIKKYYIEKGFLNAKVNITQVGDTLLSNSVMLKINIDKQERVKIKDIEIEGVTAFKLKKVKRKLKNTKEKRPWKIFTTSKFIASKFEEDKENLIKFYNKRGYRDARILWDTMYRVSPNRVSVKLKIEEGRQYYFRNITFSGNYLYDSQTLSKLLNIKKGDVYDLETLEKRLSFSQTELDISSLYMDDGYLFFRVEPVEVAVVGDSVDVEIQIFEGPQANIKNIFVNGNTKTNDKVIRREIRTIPGQKFSRSDIIRTQRELAQLGYFDPEQIGINPKPNLEEGTVDIEYNLVEKPSDQIELSGGWGGFIGFVGTLGVVFNNFSLQKAGKLRNYRPLPSGDGQKLALRFQANGIRFQNYSFTFSEPWLGGRSRKVLTFAVNHSVINDFMGFSNTRVGGLQMTNINMSIGRNLPWPDDFFSLSTSIGYQRYRLQNRTLLLSTAGLTQDSPWLKLRNGIFNSFTFNINLSRNSIDNPTYPRRGANFALSVNLTPPFSLLSGKKYVENLMQETEQGMYERFRRVEYHRWMVDNSWFTTITGKLVLNARTHFGFVGAYNRQLGVGPFERFSLGGAGLAFQQNFLLLGTEIIALRGYRDNSIVPLNEPGGVAYSKMVMELRYPLSLNPAATIFVLSFLEGGNNWATIREFNPFNLKRSVGIGARIFMPAFGMLGIDWAYGFDRITGRPDASKAQFHFTIGQQIR
ncbi:MAG: outer membrane protein assembly factor BamA [Microscillaceae bacterium]|nr:outer membrane protein assembly factor BamA [Microscillaceae bacterium]MDW8461871.1 outer membrane protein assembly factor BamA [Cytophagales bacterium]